MGPELIIIISENMHLFKTLVEARPTFHKENSPSVQRIKRIVTHDSMQYGHNAMTSSDKQKNQNQDVKVKRFSHAGVHDSSSISSLQKYKTTHHSS